MGDSDDFQPEVKSKKRKRSDSKPKATQAGSITAFFNSTKTEKPVINLTDEKENTNNSENNSEGEVRRSPRKRRRLEPSSNNDSTGLPSSSPVTAQEVIFIADSQSQSQPKNDAQKTATPTKPKRGKTKQKEIVDESSNKENSAAPVNIEPAKVENTVEPAATSTEGETIGRRLRPRSPVKTTDNQVASNSTTSPSKAQKAAQIDVDSSDPPSTSASEDNFFTRMTKRTPTKSKKKEEVAPAAPKVDEVFAVKPGEKVHDFFLAASKKKEIKLQRELQKLDEEVASSRSLAQQITGDKKPHPFLLKNPAFKMTVVKEKPAGETTEQVAFEGPTLRLIEFPFVSHVGISTTEDKDKMEDVIESSNSNNSADLFSSDSQNELVPNSPSADPALFRDVLDSCVKVRLSDVVVNPIKKPVTVEIKEDTPVTTADLEQFEKTSAFEDIVKLVDQQQLAFNSLELTISQALNAANEVPSADEDSDSSQSSSSKKKEKAENINPKSHFVDPPTLEPDQIRSHLRTTMAKTIKQSNDAQVKANPLWTDKYAPTGVNEVCGNIIAVKFLSAWMSKWKTQKTKERKRKNKKDDDDEYMVEQLPNTVLLHGASGVGKTAAVYACAKQIGLSVLELNPSAQRSAKEVAKYGEITQSQAIRGQSKDASEAPKENNQTLNNFFKVQSKQPAKDNKTTASEAQFDNTILLFDEVDIIDEEKDRGFYSALVELVKSTKRPIIVTCNTIPEELSALLNLPILQLKLRPMPKAHFLSYLKLVALCEGTNFTVQPAAHALEKFATFMKWDLRKSLLNLQFWLQQHDNEGMNSLVLKNDMDTPKDARLRLFRNNLLESCFGYAHLSSKYSNLFWTFLLGQEIPQNSLSSNNNSSDSQQQSFFSFYYNKQRQKLMQSNNDDSPLFFSATIPKSEIQWKMEKEDTFFIAETAHLLRLDIVFNNYLQLFIEPVLPYQQALFTMKKTYEQIEVEEKIPILVLQDTPEEKPTIEISENKPSDETSEKQPEKKSPINSPKKTTTLLNFFTKVAPVSPSKEQKVNTGQPAGADPTTAAVAEVAVEEKKESDTCEQQELKVVVPAKPKVSPYKEDFIIEKRLEDKLVKAEVTLANRLGELIFNDIVQLSDNISAADEMDSIQCPSFMSDKWPYDFKPRIDQSEMSSAYEILSLRTCVANTCNQDWSIMLADRSTPSSGNNSEPLETFFNNHSVSLSTDDKTAEQMHFQKKIDTVVGPLMDSLVFRLSKATCLEYTWFYQQLCFIDEDREKTNTKRRFTSMLPKFRIYANESKMLKEMSLVKY